MTPVARHRMGASTPGGAVLLDGKGLSQEIRAGLGAEMVRLGRPAITLATVLVGDDRASRGYVGSKGRAAEAIGVRSRHIDLPATVSQVRLEETVSGLVDDQGVHGILVQLPLPSGLDPEPVLELLSPAKDVDGLTEASLGRLVQGRPGHVPCTPRGVLALLERYSIPVEGRAVVVGRSTLVGLPLALLLGARGSAATVTLAHSHTKDLAEVTAQADILVSAVGAAGLIGRHHVKPGATVIDVGITRTGEGIRGDVAFDEVESVAGAITPMPGGTGPMTIACLLENLLDAARMQGAC